MKTNLTETEHKSTFHPSMTAAPTSTTSRILRSSAFEVSEASVGFGLVVIGLISLELVSSGAVAS
jgi:hypothetical protein